MMSTSWMLSVALAGVATGLLADGPAGDKASAAPRAILGNTAQSGAPNSNAQKPAAQKPGAEKPAAAAAEKDPLQLVAEGRKMITSGKVDEGIASIDKALATDPKLFEGLLAKGIALDIKGDYRGGRKLLEDANAVAQDDARDPVFSAIAISYIFEGDVANAARYYQRLFDRYIAAGRFDTAAETANALARAYLETGDVGKADQWYTTAREHSKKLSGLPEDQVDLWTMRAHHAASRIASRKGDHKTAAREAEAVKQLVDKNQMNGTQMPIYLYLTGYNALYAKKYDEAIAILSKADLRDPFILGLLAQAYDKKGDKANAKANYEKAVASTGHSLQNALMRPVAKKRLASLK
jgi:tetratricopeptide (TPR) repeat protein